MALEFPSIVEAGTSQRALRRGLDADRHLRLRRLLGVWLLCLTCVRPLLAQDLPAHVGKVNDFAAVLDPGERADLERQLADLEVATSAEVALVTVNTLSGRPIEEYANALFNTWGIGKKGRDNGLLVLVALQDRAMRIEVGYGLEGILPDILAGAVIRETFLPPFGNGDYVTGVREGMARLMEIVRRHEVLTAEQRAALDRARADAAKSWDLVWLIALFVAAAAFALGTAAGAQVVSQLAFGICFTVGALWGSTFLVPRTAVWLLALLATSVAIVGAILARRPRWRRYIRGTGAGGGSSGWIADGTSGSSSSSRDGSDSGSSGSFGGGSSGGGGATGRW